MKNCISMRAIRERDLATIWQIGFREEAPEWKNWDGPYFDDYEPYKSLAEFAKAQAQHFLRDDRYAIFLGDQLIGIVSRYWENEKTLWLEIGIVIFQAQYWSSGYGTEALRLWIDKTFADFPRLEHIGLTTWSGNERMMRAALAAEALGCTEAEIAKSLSFYGAEGPLLIVAAGTSSSALAMSLEELERAARAAGWVDVCKSV